MQEASSSVLTCRSEGQRREGEMRERGESQVFEFTHPNPLAQELVTAD